MTSINLDLFDGANSKNVTEIQKEIIEKYDPFKLKGMCVIPYNVLKTYIKYNALNRAVDGRHIKEISDEVKTHFDYFSPIMINFNTLHLIDGQNRMAAFEEHNFTTEGICVRFINCPEEDETDEIIACNEHTKKWQLYDYVGMYIKSGNEFYIRLDNLCKNELKTLCYDDNNKKAPIKYSNAQALLTGRECTSDIKKGKFEFTDENVRMAIVISNEIISILKVMNGNDSKSLAFNDISRVATAWYEFRELYKMEEWINGFKKERNNVNKLPRKSKQDWKTIFSVVQSYIAINNKKIA